VMLVGGGVASQATITDSKSVPASVRVAVESLDCMLKSIPSGEESVPG